ncbi:unnamed protein product [Ectocarpus sp. 8 AP-2014]
MSNPLEKHQRFETKRKNDEQHCGTGGSPPPNHFDDWIDSQASRFTRIAQCNQSVNQPINQSASRPDEKTTRTRHAFHLSCTPSPPCLSAVGEERGGGEGRLFLGSFFRAMFNVQDAKRKRKWSEIAASRWTRKINKYAREHHPESEMKPKCHSQQKKQKTDNMRTYTTGQKCMQERGE